jgi:uncharacterized protein YceK
MKLLTLCLAVVILTGCGVAKNTAEPVGIVKKNEYGITYIETCIEDHNFIATQSAYNYWNFAGPLGECNINLN